MQLPPQLQQQGMAGAAVPPAGAAAPLQQPQQPAAPQPAAAAASALVWALEGESPEEVRARSAQYAVKAMQASHADLEARLASILG
jgi:hypothetical protein